jgi:hypothetical protein
MVVFDYVDGFSRVEISAIASAHKRLNRRHAVSLALLVFFCVG